MNPMDEQGLMDQAPEEVPGEPGLIDASDEELSNEVMDGISDYLFGEAQEHVAQSIAESGEEVDQTIAAIAYQTITQAAHQVEQSNPGMMTLDFLLPLATETIDYLIEVAHAVGAPMTDEQETRERALIEMVQLHMAAVQDDPEQKAEAEQMLAEMIEDGTYDQGMSYVQEKAKKEGADPAKIQQMGEQMLQPRQDPLAQGVQQGLMEQDQGMNPGGMA